MYILDNAVQTRYQHVMEIETLLTKSFNWRFEQQKSIDKDFEAIRLFAGQSDGIEGMLIEQYGELILASLYNSELSNSKDRILEFLNLYFPKKSILIKARDEMNAGKFVYTNNDKYSTDSILSCIENGLKYEIHTDPRHDYGLYLDTKAARNYLRANSKNKNVLNLFSYTCAFGIAAMKGDAKSVTNIDPNKEYLEWGQHSADLNQIQFKKYPDTTQAYLARHNRRLESGKDSPYDLIVVDPPAFLVGRGSNRLARNLWPTWMQALKDSRCREFIIIINDKSLGRQKNLSDFFTQGLGESIEIIPIKQSFDVIGQELNSTNDPFYFNPAIFSIKKYD
jgi:23S rRNA G2069 N7-methylase RlmK/C1962 C5-methylase RlmI